jgi:hypothetical protein
MFDWLGSLEIREHTALRVVLALSRSTRITGLVVCLFASYLAARLWSLSPWLSVVPAMGAMFGLLLVTLHRQLIVDREAGVLRLDQSAFGIGNQSVVPLFHLRAVVIVARPQRFGTTHGLLPTSSRYVAYLDRRIGDAIYLDESRRCASLLRLAEAIADVAEVRLEYEATPPSAA